ncbi:MAG TPA: NC domain-containing protein [Cyanobacteria bacterium UBA12227]|nr:NC domain-containing protein [Cyanobacteria bacterium UBA12227]HAX84984.1 NC domain-containing protein [Cyanobacteria bacterium UBA11370]HBY78749.1 NC domain-containing protein [Cyanobacteria bacterium UBA11148]
MARGDQLYVHRELLNLQGVYEHHGIDCGDGTVIHYRKPSETIERTSLTTFARGNKIYVKQYPTCFIPDVVIQRAKSRLGERNYNLLFNNCEHLATWCKTGVSYSQQIKDFVPVIDQMNTDKLYEPIKRAIEEGNKEKAAQLLNQALADIKVIWDTLQPEYNHAVREMNIWQKVAIQALKQNREDLARAALERKQNYEKSATEKKAKLDRLANMTETLVRNRLNI